MKGNLPYSSLLSKNTSDRSFLPAGSSLLFRSTTVNTDPFHTFLTNRAMGLFHTGILHSHFFLQAGPTNVKPSTLFGHRNPVKRSSGNQIFQMTDVLTPLIASVSPERCFVQRGKFTLLNNGLRITQCFPDCYSKAPRNLMEKGI